MYSINGITYQLLKEYYDFFNLFYVKDDLLVQTYQYYIEGADRDNIDMLIKTRFELRLLGGYNRIF